MIYWIWLQLALGQGSDRASLIREKFSSVRKVYESGDAGRAASGVFNQRELRLLRDTPLSKAESILNKCTKENISILTYDSNIYPEILRNIPDPPFVLYVKGRLPDFDNTPSICIVGPRKVTDYGYKCAYSLSGRLCRGGFLIVSGGAMGSDSAAHQGALLNGGKTVAVLANGFGNNYLSQNEELRQSILENGCLITEYPPDTPVTKGAFHARNRIMSGLCSGVIVVEAHEKSGTLITANRAVEQNRDLFVIPGNPGLPQYVASNKLIRDGAKPLIDLNDIFSEYNNKFYGKIDIEKAMSSPLAKMVRYAPTKSDTIKKQTQKFEKMPTKTEENKFIKKILPENLSKNAKIIYNQLNKQIFTCDDLLSPTMNVSTIMSAIGELELMGYIKSLPGGRYTFK